MACWASISAGRIHRWRRKTERARLSRHTETAEAIDYMLKCGRPSPVSSMMAVSA
jgi:hypothetical protein